MPEADFVIPPDTFCLVEVTFLGTNYLHLQFLGAFL